MFIDLLGGDFSILSFVFKRHVDVFVAAAYTLFVVRPSGQRLLATGHYQWRGPPDVTHLTDWNFFVCLPVYVARAAAV